MNQVVNMAGRYAPVGGQRLHGKMTCRHDGDRFVVHVSSNVLCVKLMLLTAAALPLLLSLCLAWPCIPVPVAGSSKIRQPLKRGLLP